MTNLKSLTPFACLFLVGVAAAGPNDPMTLGLQLAQVDYDTVHSVLIERCKSSSPDSVTTLVAAIASWKAKNDPALQQLRLLSRDGLVKSRGLSESEASAQLSRSSELLTAGLKGQFERVAYSRPNWTLIPPQTGQAFHGKLDTDSSANWTVK